ncbi:MAG: lipid-A-disaccharide synthase [Planctomycetota bacterium]
MKKILIVAGETSGDLHGSNLVLAIKSLPVGADGPPHFFGLGGVRMQNAGVELLEPLTHHAGTGLDPLINIAHFARIFRKLVSALRTRKPDLVILIDFPDFNLRFARRVKEYNILVVYYISPQIWAWRKGRIKTIKRYVDKMLVIFEFEKGIYQKANVPVEFVGHPLLDALQKNREGEMLNSVHNHKEQSRKLLGFNKDDLIIGILPGSRPSGFKRHFPLMQKAALIISNKRKDIKYILAAAPDITPQLVNKMIHLESVPITPFYNKNYEVISASDILITVSGTVTIEAALFRTPMVVIYKVSFLTELIFAPLIKTPYYSMVNIIAQKKIVPELMQRDASPSRIAENVISLIQDNKLSKMRDDLGEIRQKLGSPGASKRAAQIIYKMLYSVRDA